MSDARIALANFIGENPYAILIVPLVFWAIIALCLKVASNREVINNSTHDIWE